MGPPNHQIFRLYDSLKNNPPSDFQLTTINRKIFVVKIFSDGMDNAKIIRTKIMHIINDNAVRGCLSENYLTRTFITQNI